MTDGTSSSSPRLRSAPSQAGALEVADVAHQDASGERVAVRSKPRRREADQDVTVANALGTEFVTAFDDADGEARHVEVIGRHDARVFRGLATEEGGPGDPTAFGDAGDQLFEPRRFEFADGDVVEEEERLGTDAGEVVDQHRDEVDPDRVVASDLTRDVELGADAVGRGDEHRRRVLRRVEGEQPAEAADAAQHLGPLRAGDDVLDPLDRLVTRFNRHSRPRRRSCR